MAKSTSSLEYQVAVTVQTIGCEKSKCEQAQQK